MKETNCIERFLQMVQNDGKHRLSNHLALNDGDGSDDSDDGDFVLNKTLTTLSVHTDIGRRNIVSGQENANSFENDPGLAYRHSR